MNEQINLLLQNLIAPEKVTDSELQSFGANIADILITLPDPELYSTLEIIHTALIDKGHNAYNATEDFYEYLCTTYFMRGVYHHVKAHSKEKEACEIIWRKIADFFKSKEKPKTFYSRNNATQQPVGNTSENDLNNNDNNIVPGINVSMSVENNSTMPNTEKAPDMS